METDFAAAVCGWAIRYGSGFDQVGIGHTTRSRAVGGGLAGLPFVTATYRLHGSCLLHGSVPQVTHVPGQGLVEQVRGVLAARGGHGSV